MRALLPSLLLMAASCALEHAESAVRETIVNPLGVVSQPNKFGVYPPGAMKTARNCVMRNPSRLTAIRQAQEIYVGVVTSQKLVPMIHATSAQLFEIVFDVGSSLWELWWIDAGVKTTATLPANDIFSQVGRTDVVTLRERPILSTVFNPVIADYEDPSSTLQRSFRWTQITQPKIYTIATVVAVPDGAVRADTVVTYSAVVRRLFPDGYEIVGPPAPPVRFAANVDCNPTVQIHIGGDGSISNVMAGDIVELYRSQAIDAGTLPADPPRARDPGDTLYLVHRATLTSTSLTINIVDTAQAAFIGESLGGLGEALYTNPLQQGADGAYLPPPAAKCLAVYKGRAFYGNTTEPGQFRASFRGGQGKLDTSSGATAFNRLNGVGERSVTATWANGSNVLTGISAAEMVGIKTGQKLTQKAAGVGGVTFSTTITAVGATTITMSDATTGAGGSAIFGWSDVLELDGLSVVVVRSILDLFSSGGTSYLAAATNTLLHYGEDFTTDQTIVMQRYRIRDFNGSISVRGTNGQNYDPPIPVVTQVNNSGIVTAGSAAQVFLKTFLPNQLTWSEDQQPESVPSRNEFFVGAGEIYSMQATRDALWIFASDGLWRLSGTMTRSGGIPDVRVDPVDSTLILAGPKAARVLRDSVYAYTNRGLVRVDDNGIAELSNGLVGDQVPGEFWSETTAIFVAADEETDEIYLFLGVPPTVATWMFSTKYSCFTTMEAASATLRTTAADYSRAITSIVTASNDPLGTTFGAIWQHDSAATYRSVFLEFQPIYGDDAMGIKQWIDATAVFDLGASGMAVAPSWSGLGESSNFVVAYARDARVNFGVPREAPAVSPTIEPGLTFGDGQVTERSLYGLSLRFEDLSDQQVTR